MCLYRIDTGDSIYMAGQITGELAKSKPVYSGLAIPVPLLRARILVDAGLVACTLWGGVKLALAMVIKHHFLNRSQSKGRNIS